MKYEDLINDKERELMKPVYERMGPVRQCLVDAIAKYDKDQAKLGQESCIYMFFDPLVTDEMCEMLKCMKYRKPMYPKEIAKSWKQPVEKVVEVGSELAQIGLLEYWPDNKNIDRFYMPQLCVGVLEWIMIDKNNIEKHPEEALLFEHYTFERFTGKGIYMPMTNRGVHRTVPIESALSPDVKRMDWEELSKLIDSNAEDTYCVGTCICRQGREIMGESSGEPSNEWCLALGHLAKYMIRTGRARQISRDEFLNILKEAENRGFVHNVANANGTAIEYICNCDHKSCYTLRADLYSQNSSMTRSNFVAQVDVDKCVACGRCVETCPMNAVKMGQRLDQKKNRLEYHYKETPREYMKWGEDKWHPDYLHERENVWKETGTAPCKTNCPAHIAVEGYLRLAALGRFDDALKMIKNNNPLPAVCGSICNRRCETACSRGKIDEPVAIDEVKKFLAYRELKKEHRYVPEKIETWKDGKKVAVIGSGPAGLSCAYYLEVLGENVTVFEKQNKIGGMLQYGIPSFRLEKDIVDAEIDVIRELGAEFRTGIEVGKDVTIDQLRAEGFEAFYFAIGLQSCGNLGIPGEKAKGVMGGVDFVRRVNDGEHDILNGNVVVIGGGNIGADVARTAVRAGASKVDLYCLEPYDDMPMGLGDRDEVEEDGITIHAGWGQTEIITEGDRCKSIKFRKCLSVKNNDGKFDPKFDDSITETADADHVLYCIGQKADWGNLLDGTNVKLSGRGLAEADDFTFQTSQPDVFVGGDVYTGQKFCIDAIAAGKEAAESIHRYVWGGSLTTGRDRNIYFDINNDDVDFGSYDNAGRQIPAKNGAKRLSFSDEREVFTEEQVMAETARCLRCGASHVDENMCLGCAVCTTRCEFDAIHIRRVFDRKPTPVEHLVPEVLGEVGRRLVWSKFNKPTVKSVKVGTHIDPNVTVATGAKYHRAKSEKLARRKNNA